jgi:beta-glucanase (GH16 family)
MDQMGRDMRLFHWIGCAAIGLAVALWMPKLMAAPMGPATWGNPNQSWGTRRPVTAADRAQTARDRSRRPMFETDFTNSSVLQSQWTLQTDDRSDLQSCRLPANVVATPGGLQLRTTAASACHAKWATGSMISKAKHRYGLFEASIQAADISGVNNALWLVSDAGYEIDIVEAHYPNDVHMTLHDWHPGGGAVGFDSKCACNLAAEFHDYGVLWTPTDLIFEIDGEPIAAITGVSGIDQAADIRFATALASFAGKIPDNPAGHHMAVRALRVFAN